MKICILWVVTACSPFKIIGHYEEIHGLIDIFFKFNSCLAYFSALNIEPTWSTETSVDYQRTTQHLFSKTQDSSFYICYISLCPFQILS
jgi:hypothetical protein